jgi:mitochondrial chaperone BCS1
MGLSAILREAMPTLSANMTSFANNMTEGGLPEGLAHLLPLLGTRFTPLLQPLMVIYHMMGSRLGLDPTLMLTLFGFFWAFNKMWRQVYGSLYALLHEYLTANIHISSTDEIYLHLMKWLAQQPKLYNSRSLMAETVGKTAWEDEEDTDVLKRRISPDGKMVYLNFSNQEAKSVRIAPKLPRL